MKSLNRTHRCRRPDDNIHGIGGSEGPDIGDFKDVAVIELLVKPGDTVKAEQS